MFGGVHMKKLVIMRGLPWCGKSTRAKEIAGDEGLIFSTDEYWYKVHKPEKPDVYSFNPRFLEDAHNWNRLRAERAMWNESPLVIIDNTNTTLRDRWDCGRLRDCDRRTHLSTLARNPQIAVG